MGTINEAMTFNGAVRFGSTIEIPDGSVSDANIAEGAGIKATKMQHRHYLTPVRDPSTTAATTRTFVGHIVVGTTATLYEVSSVVDVACVGSAVVTVDVQKEGVTALEDVITIDSSTTPGTPETSVVQADSYVAGDVLEVVVTVTLAGGTACKGLTVQMLVDEDPV